MGSYIASTKQEQQEMLKTIGCNNFEELFSQIPVKVKKIDKLNLPEGMSELEIRRYMETMASENTVYQSIFRGAGAYDHYIPEIVKSIVNKEEFLTAYTPYQAEISQGLLQSIFEYQTMICKITGMDCSNASVYDGATAAAEATVMCRERKRNQVLVSETVHPDTLSTIRTYCFGNGMEVTLIPEKDGITDTAFINNKMDDRTACIFVQQPNYYGIIEDAGKIGELAHQVGAKFIMGVNPISLGLLKTPKEYGADIAVGDGQPLGMPLSFGGPYLGFMACVSDMMRKLPGRIVGETIDTQGKRGFVLTLQSREQHIRREKASSNICSNQALCAMTTAVYLAAMGDTGLKQAALLSASKAAYLQKELEKDGFHLVYSKPFFHEFLTTSPIAPQKVEQLLSNAGILSGYPLAGEKIGTILWCCTEKNKKEDIDKLIQVLKGVAEHETNI